MEINKELIQQLFDQAAANPRLRQNFDLRTTAEDNSQRMLNAMLPGSQVPVHRHPMSNENVILLCGRMDEILCNEKGEEVERIHLCPSDGRYGCMVPAGVWHTVEIHEPSVIFEAKDGRFGEDGSETFSSPVSKA
ncbi:MAG: WbuC family cupin fold metalloprotein [Bacteroidaceae bacterium]|nr:WbuC family cupin fold metalloprotein [Bacteroidaceae bacterium]